MTKRDDSAVDETFDSVAAYKKAYPGWMPIEEKPGTELTMDILKNAGGAPVLMGREDEPEGHELSYVADGGRRRRKTRRGKKARRSTRKSHR